MEQKEMIYRIGNRLGEGWRVKGVFFYSPNTQYPTPKRAFTLMEMLVVLAIIALLLGISVPFTSGFGKSLRITTAARALSGTLRVARSNAITYREKYFVIFDVENGEYWLEDSEGRIFEKKRKLPSSVKFEVQDDEESDPITFENDRVTFYSTGAIEGPSGSITITDRQGASKTISILGSTGSITIGRETPL